MAPRLSSWVCHDQLLHILCGMSLCLILCSVALAEDDNSEHETPDPLNSYNNASEKNFYRLPRHIVPKNYNLTLWPDMNKKTFRGSVAIQFEALMPTRTIQLHSNKLVIISVSLRGNGKDIPIKSTSASLDRRELIIVDLFNEVTKGTYQIYVTFEGKLDNGIIAFYASSLKNNKARHLCRCRMPATSWAFIFSGLKICVKLSARKW